jgi:hypothetical protein
MRLPVFKLEASAFIGGLFYVFKKGNSKKIEEKYMERMIHLEIKTNGNFPFFAFCVRHYRHSNGKS